MQDFLDSIIKTPKNPLTSAMLGLVGQLLSYDLFILFGYLTLISSLLSLYIYLEARKEGCMDFGEFVEVSHLLLVIVMTEPKYITIII